MILDLRFDTLDNLSEFNDVNELKETVCAFIDNNKNILTENQKMVIIYILEKSLNSLGVLNIPIEMITKELKISRSTVERGIRILKNLEILKVYETHRKNGGKCGSTYVITKKIFNPNGEETINKKYKNGFLLKIKRNIKNKKELTGIKRDIPPKLRVQVLNRDCSTCCLCGARAPEVKIHIDHIVPYSKGGKTTLSNLQCLCEDCNLGKSNIIELHINKTI